MSRASVLVASLAALAMASCGSSKTVATEERAALAAAPAPPATTVARATTAVPAPTPTDDAEAAQSFPSADPAALTEKAPAPEDAKPTAASSGESSEAEQYISPGAPSDAQIARELKQLERLQRGDDTGASGAEAGAARLNADGTASPPRGAPEVVRRIISAANAIAKFPYVYGGGHGDFIDTAYDCSGSVSYALAAAGLVKRPMVSGAFAKTGAAGPGRWVTIYASDGHMFMVVAGLRYDTSGRGGPLGSRWQTAARSTRGMEVRHPPGL